MYLKNANYKTKHSVLNKGSQRANIIHKIPKNVSLSTVILFNYIHVLITKI